MSAFGQSAAASLGKLAESSVGQGAARVLVALGELAFPLGCPACGAGLENQGPFCGSCAEEVRLLTNPTQASYGDSARALAVYDGPVGQTLRGFKYNRRLAGGAALADWPGKHRRSGCLISI